MPPLPGWDGFHPLIIHFPIGLLFAVPVLLFLALIIPKHRQGLALAAFALMLMGTVAAMVSISTGEAAAEIADRTPAVNAVIEHHEELAEQVRTLFIILTIVFAAILLLPVLFRRPIGRAFGVTSLGILLVLTLAGDLLIANTAHQGGRLVHEFGVHSIVALSGGSPGIPGDMESETNED